ncbi:MAG: NAD(P)-dependent glycerol-3-phosphate dehydrogenase [Coraliomargarita sp. TMED73]|nr:MAG: NAD(P)-dependent glycerol-3-phosphate dehydrogenase [Coraliomargarita sp. TMED73]
MNICILGAGAWGTAMALHLERCGHSVTLVPRRMEQALALASSRENTDYLPGYSLPGSIQIGYEPAPVLMEAEVVFLACPTKGLRALCQQLAGSLEDAWQLKLFVVLCKGLDSATLQTPAETVRTFFPDIASAALSGPTRAAEVAAGQPTAIALAVEESFEEANDYQRAFSSPALRVYLSHDLRGTELGGTLKNIYAIAAGICDGLALGDNAKAALLTRSLSEMVTIGELLGGQRATFHGLSGFGDLVATCTGSWSRNRSFGEQIGRGSRPADLMENRKTVVEGYWATQCVKELCQTRGLEAPILGQVHSVLYQERDPQAALEALMGRDLKAE